MPAEPPDLARSEPDADPLAEHHDLSPTERRVFRRLAAGERDEEVAMAEGMSKVAVRSCLRRFRDRTGLVYRRLAIWAARHIACCIEQAGSVAS